MTDRTEAQRAADARYESKRRGPTVVIRMTEAQNYWLETKRRYGETRVAAITRLLGIDHL